MTAVGGWLAWLDVAAVGLLTAHAAINARLLPRPPTDPSVVDFAVSVLVPLRDEARRLPACLAALLAQRGLAHYEIVVLDDGSTDGSAALAGELAAGDARVRVATGGPLPPGWLGKPYACHQLAGLASPASRVLVFVDADVVLRPDAVAGAVALLHGVDLVSPYPQILAGSASERLVQPLLVWSWLTFLPVRAVQRSRRESLTAAGGQFLAVDRAAYRRCGGHAGVRGEVLDDIGLARAVKRAGGRIRLADGSGLASCRMYESWPELVAGYTKSLWTAFGSPAGAVAVVLALLLLYAAPAVLMLTAAVAGWWLGAAAWATAYLFGVAGRALAGRSNRARWWPDALAHPVSIAVFAWLTARSVYRHRRGRLTWKGRSLP